LLSNEQINSLFFTMANKSGIGMGPRTALSIENDI